MKAPKRFTEDIVIIDENEPCPYLPGETARMPLKMPVTRITLAEADERLSDGYRRTGEFVYKTKCPACQACQPVRIDCPEFQFSRNQKRILGRNRNCLHMESGPLMADTRRVALFNKHRRLRGLAKRDTDIDLEEYVWGFVRSCFDSFEISYWRGQTLVAVAICDRGQHSISAVYTYYDPDLRRESLGTFSILKQIEFCQERQLRYLYLGYYVRQSPHMKYKERFLPQQRLIDGHWISFNSQNPEG